MAKKKGDDALHMKYVSVVPMETAGVIEFRAWELAKWLGVWMKPFNQKTSIPHLVFLDSPSQRQITFRMLILEGQAEMPMDESEDWSPLGLEVWPTRRSFGTLWMSTHCYAKTAELRRGRLVAREVEAEAVSEPEIKAPEEEAAYIP